jgi:hypothetical protein
MSDGGGDPVLRDYEKGLEIGGKKGRLLSARTIKNARVWLLRFSALPASQ